jgi:hypothetical protein
LVTAMEGRTSTPPAISSAKTWPATCPQGSRETIFEGSNHWDGGPPPPRGGCCAGPAGRAGSWPGPRWRGPGRGRRSPRAPRSRCGRPGVVTDPITGPRSLGEPAPQRTGKRTVPAFGSGWEVRRMCVERLGVLMGFRFQRRDGRCSPRGLAAGGAWQARPVGICARTGGASMRGAPPPSQARSRPARGSRRATRASR